MLNENTAKAKAPVAAPPASAAEIDLSAEIVATVDALVGETVRCIRVYGDHYRCNWWGPESAPAAGQPIVSGLESTELRVRRSRFLKVKKTSDGLQIQDVNAQGPANARLK